MTDDWYDEPEEQSRVKADIVVSYFSAWATIMSRWAERIAYIDLYAGPGRYNNGEKTTPLLILERALASSRVAARLVTVFNDEDRSHVQRLTQEIAALPGVDHLKFKPDVGAGSVDESLADQFEKIRSVPALTFLDPWGYRGLTRRLIASVTKDFGCETIFFFNLNRVNAAISNNLVEPHMEALFTPVRLAGLRRELGSLSPSQRESHVLRALAEAVQETEARYFIPFRFRRPNGRTSHYICFASKNVRGYTIMKEVMASHGAVDQDGVPTFEFLPRAEGEQLSFETDRPIRRLPAGLLQRFAGQTLTVQEIYDRHNVDTPFILKNYQRVLLEMEAEGRIMCKSTRTRRPAGTMAKHLLVTFLSPNPPSGGR